MIIVISSNVIFPLTNMSEPYPEQIWYLMTGMGAQKMSPKTKSWFLKLTYLFLQKFYETLQYFTIDYSLNSKCGMKIYSFNCSLIWTLKWFAQNALDKLMILNNTVETNSVTSYRRLRLGQNNWFAQILEEIAA